VFNKACEGKQPAPTPRAMSRMDIEETVRDFADAAWMAIEADADAVEIYAANGYLLHQFMAPKARRHARRARRGPRRRRCLQHQAFGLVAPALPRPGVLTTAPSLPWPRWPPRA
jgi:hypothetical protein